MEPESLLGSQSVEPESELGSQSVKPESLLGSWSVEPESKLGSQSVEQECGARVRFHMSGTMCVEFLVIFYPILTPHTLL